MSTMSKPKHLAVALVCALAFTGCDKKGDVISNAAQADPNVGIAAPGIAEIKAIAEEGFIYGLPLVMNYTANYQFWLDKTSSQYKCPLNQLFSERRVFTYKDTAVVVPNSDTPYSFVCLDLRAEPYVVSVPAVEKERYYSIQFVDWNTFNYGYVGSRATGNEAGDYLVAGPDWKGGTPAGIKGVLRPTTQFTLAIFRTQLFGPDDMPNVAKVQDGYKVQLLSAFLKQPAPPAAPALDFPKANEELAKTNFFEYVDFALQFASAGPEEKEIRAKLAKIGIGPGKTFNFKDLSLEHKAAVLIGLKEGMKRSRQRLRRSAKKSTAGASGPPSATASFTRAIGCCAPPPPRPASLAIAPTRPCIPCRGGLPTARPSTAASTTTRSPSPPANSRR